MLTDHTWAEVGLESNDLSSIPVTAFEVVAYDSPVELTGDCALNDIGMTYDCDNLPNVGNSLHSPTLACVGCLLVSLIFKIRW